MRLYRMHMRRGSLIAAAAAAVVSHSFLYSLQQSDAMGFEVRKIAFFLAPLMQLRAILMDVGVAIAQSWAISIQKNCISPWVIALFPMTHTAMTNI